MNSNSKGSYPSTREAMMRAFDKFPARLRKAIADSDENWAVQPIRTMFEYNGRSVDDLIKALRRWDTSRREAKKMKKVWGVSNHPQVIKAKAQK